MTKEELIGKLELLAENNDSEAAHERADRLLIQYIDDDEIESAYEAIEKYYA